MSNVFEQINIVEKKQPSILHIRNALEQYDLENEINGLTVAYDLLLLNRPTDSTQIGSQYFGQVLIEFGYSVTNKKDMYHKKKGRDKALRNLYDVGQTKRNYGVFSLGVGYDAETVDFQLSEGQTVHIPLNGVPLRIVDGNKPWVLAKDYPLVATVVDKVVYDFMTNEVYA